MRRKPRCCLVMWLLLSPASAAVPPEPPEPPRSLNYSPAHSPLPLWAALPLILLFGVIFVNMTVKRSSGASAQPSKKQRNAAAATPPVAAQPASHGESREPPSESQADDVLYTDASGVHHRRANSQQPSAERFSAGSVHLSEDEDALGVHHRRAVSPQPSSSAHHAGSVHLWNVEDDLFGSEGGVHHPGGESTSVDSEQRKFVDACFTDQQSPDPLRPCELFECVGQTIGMDGQFKTCQKRLNQHTRGKVCKVHHRYRQCSACPNIIHNECKQLGPNQHAGNAPWKCTTCIAKEAVQASIQVKQEKDADKLDKEAAHATAVVLMKSRESLVKDLKREGYKVRSSGGDLGSRFMRMECGVASEPGSANSHKCTLAFKVYEKGEDCWHIVNRPDAHPCCPEFSTSYHQKVRFLPEDCLKEIKKLAPSGAFDSKSIQDHLHATNGWKVATELIYMIGYRARAKIFGGTGSNDTLHLIAQQEKRRQMGDTYNLHYSSQGNLKHVVWVSSFAHLLVQYFDYFLCDGTHGISKYGWKFVPLCIVTSGDWIIPIGAVFGLEEDTESLSLLHAAIRAHCGKHNVPCPAFQPLDPSKARAGEAPSPARSWAKTWLRNFLYPPEYESCVVMSMVQSWQRQSTAIQDSKCENCGIQGHSSKWCPLAKRTGASDPLTTEETSDVSKYFDFLSSCPIQFPDGDISAAASKAASLEKPPTLHTDGGSAFGPLCREIDRLRTACAIHLESKVASCNQVIKGLVTRYV